MLAIPLEQVTEEHRCMVGGKTLALATMRREGLRVVDGLCLTTRAYDEFVGAAEMKARYLKSGSVRRLAAMSVTPRGEGVLVLDIEPAPEQLGAHLGQGVGIGVLVGHVPQFAGITSQVV